MTAILEQPSKRTPPSRPPPAAPPAEAPPAGPESEPGPQPGRLLDLQQIAAHWQLALDAADGALRAAAADSLPGEETGVRRRALDRERHETATAIGRLAHATGVRPVPWLSPVPMRNELLGLPTSVRACLFDLDGVLTDSAALHAWAWGEVLDEYLLRLSDKTGWQFVPFDRDEDYRNYIDGRSRLEGVHAFLDSRGIRVPEGKPGDPPDAPTASGLARRKGETLERALAGRGVAALPGARRYLEAAGRADLGRAVVSASASTLRMAELAGLASLLEEHVDADVIRREKLRSRPAPDLLLVACRRLGIRPEDAVTFTHSAAGVAAGHTAGLLVIGVGEGELGELLHGFGAERVVPSLGALLDPRLAER